MSHQGKDKIIVGVGLLMILCGLLANPWFLKPLLRMADSQISILRVLVVSLFDVVSIAIGAYWVARPRKLADAVKKVIFSVSAIFLALCTIEILLWVTTWSSPSFRRLLSGVAIPQKIHDARLGHRPNPDFPEHDDRGFRNRFTLKQADIVAIGDSQTYGTGVRRHQAWPHQLSLLSGLPVYNMSYGGYGSVEALALLEEAKTLNPRLIIFALYNGNDLVDAFEAVYNLGLYPELKSEGPLRSRIEEIEKVSPLLSEVKEITSGIWGKQSDLQGESSTAAKKNLSYGKKIKQIRLLRLFFAVERIIQETIMMSGNRWLYVATQSKMSDSGGYEVFDVKEYFTIFTPAYRHKAMDIEDMRVAEGLTVSLKAIEQMKRLTEAEGIDFLVLILSTKEYAFYELNMCYNLELSDSMEWLVAQENIILERTETCFNQHGISYINTVPMLRRSFDKGRQPYFMDADGHLNTVGQRVVAQAVYEYLHALQDARHDTSEPQ